MRQKLSSILLVVALSALPFHAWGFSLSARELQSAVHGLSAAEAEQLAQKGQVTHFFKADTNPRLVPDCSLTQSVQESFSSVPHTIGVEALFVMDPGNGSHDARMLRWYNILRSISTMKGIRYYSVTHGRMRVLFRDSFVINNVKQQRRMPDQLVSAIPSDSDLTIKQDDSTFGEALFHLHYRGALDAISMSMVNLNTLFLWFIPVIGKRQMMLQLVLVPFKNSLIFYGGVEVKTISLFGLQNATRDSLVNRVEALHRWFETLANPR